MWCPGPAVVGFEAVCAGSIPRRALNVRGFFYVFKLCSLAEKRVREERADDAKSDFNEREGTFKQGIP